MNSKIRKDVEQLKKRIIPKRESWRDSADKIQALLSRHANLEREYLKTHTEKELWNMERESAKEALIDIGKLLKLSEELKHE